MAGIPEQDPNVVNVKDSYGKYYNAPVDRVGELLDKGYELVSPEERRKVLLEKEYGGTAGELAAGGLGAARGLTFGASDWVMRGLGVDKETLAAYKEANPTASTVGEIGGAVLPLVASGGTGAIAKGAQVAGKGVLSAAKAGQGVAGLATRAAGAAGLAKGGLASRALAMGAAGATEGVLFGGGQLISEAALGDPAEVAENIIPHLGASALIGFGAGAAMPALGDALRAGGRSIAKGGDRLARAISPADDAARPIAETIEEGLQEKSARKLLAKPFTKEGAAERSKLFTSAKEREAASRSFVDSTDDAFRQIDDLSRKSGQSARKKEIKKLLEGAAPDAAWDDATRALDDIDSTIQTMKAEPDLYHKGVVREMELASNGLRERLTGEGIETAEDVYNAVNSTRSALGKRLSKFGKSPDPIVRDSHRMAQQSAYGALKKHLANPEVYGQAGARTSAYNQAAERLINAKKNMLKTFGTDVIERGGVKTRKLAPHRINTFLRGVGSTRGEGRNSVVMEFLEASDEFLGQLDETAKTAAVDTAGGRTALESMKAARDSAEDLLGKHNVITQHEPFTSDLSGKVDRIAQTLDPVNLARTLSAVEGAVDFTGQIARKTSDAVARRIQDGLRTHTSNTDTLVRRVLGATASGVRRGTAAAAKATHRGAGVLAKDQAVSEIRPTFRSAAPRVAAVLSAKDLGERIERIKEARRDPIKFAEGVISSTVGDGHTYAPAITAQIVRTTMRAADFLESKLPKSGASLKTVLGGAGLERDMSEMERAKLSHYIRAIEKPDTVLEDLADGTLTMEAAEAFRAVYPARHKALVMKFAENADAVRAMPYDRRVDLSILLGAPLEESMLPEFVQMSQAAYIGEEGGEATAPGAVRMTSGGMSNLNIADRNKTPSERRQTR